MSQRTTRITLSGGQSMQLQARRGMTIAAVRGKVRICGTPAWLAGQLVSARIDLSEGSSHVLQDAGVISIAALGSVEVICVVDRMEVLHSLAGAIVVCMHSLRRWRQAVAPQARRG